MIGKVKKWLGIEGVKLELVLPDLAFTEVGAISGKIRFFTKSPQTVKWVKIVMVERYSRGRGKDKLTDEYVMGEMILEKKFDVPADKAVEVGFTLPFQKAESPIDAFGQKNFLTGGLATVAKALRKVKSEYRIVAEAKVAGTALNPFDEKGIGLKD